jgi:hypothetical protein
VAAADQRVARHRVTQVYSRLSGTSMPLLLWKRPALLRRRPGAVLDAALDSCV